MRRHAPLLAGIVLVTALIWPLTGTSCISRASTGLPCPGCGLTRSVLALLRGDWRLSFQMHPLTVPLGLVGLYFLVKYLLHLAGRPLDKVLNPTKLANCEKKAMIGLIIAFLVVYVLRMILFFPNQAPMTWNQDSIIGQLLRLGQLLLEKLRSMS